jgi:hypothetical protein
MPIEHAHSYLLHAGKNPETAASEIGGVKVPATGKLAEMLQGLFASGDTECDIDVIFRPDSNGAQKNPCQTLLESYSRHPSLPNGRKIAERLQSVTTHRSGLGLLFIVAGRDAIGPRLMLSRFPAESGVVAHERSRGLSVEFIERVFMKNAKAYKSVIYVARPGFWDGKAVDKQVDGGKELSAYWITDFLDSDLRTTGATGSMRLATAVRKATQSTTGDVRSELVAAAQLMRNQHGRVTSASRIVAELQISSAAAAAIRKHMPRAELFDERFRFSRSDYDDQIAFRSVELDNGGMMIADNAQFDEIFRHEVIGNNTNRRRFVTEGTIVDQKLRKTS